MLREKHVCWFSFLHIKYCTIYYKSQHIKNFSYSAKIVFKFGEISSKDINTELNLNRKHKNKSWNSDIYCEVKNWKLKMLRWHFYEKLQTSLKFFTFCPFFSVLTKSFKSCKALNILFRNMKWQKLNTVFSSVKST